jgi:hypothetical protein
MASAPFRTSVRMPGRPKNSLGPLMLFHGCDKDVAESVLSGQATLQPSEMVDKIHESKSIEAYDTIYGVFEEDELVYPGAGFRDRTHVQITIRNPMMISGYFRVDALT